MRKYAIAAAALLVSAASLEGVAAAAPSGKENSVKGDKASPQGGGGAGGGGGATTDVAAPTMDAIRTNPDKASTGKQQPKPWEVSAGWEGHRLFRQNDLSGAAPDKFFNYYFASFRYDFTKYDRAAVSAGLYQRFLSDPQETGVRADDISLAYTRLVPLPQEFLFSATGSVIAPTSFVSYREGLITAPRLGLRLDKKIGEYVDVDVRTFGTYFIQRYSSIYQGSTPNPKARVGAALDGEVTMPFHKPLSAGAGLYTSYGWYYSASSTPPPEPGAGQAGVTPDANTPQQPIQQSYGGEIFVRYRMPEVFTGFHADASVAYAQGDPTLGYTSTLHDGVSHLYLFYRQTSELYATLTAHY